MSLSKLLLRLTGRDSIIFESTPDFSDNTYWLFRYLVTHTGIQEKYRLVWFVNDSSRTRANLCGVPVVCVNNTRYTPWVRIRRLFYRYTARAIIDCNHFVRKCRPEQIRIHLGHGMPIKIPEQYLQELGDVDYLPITGEGFRSFYAQYLPSDAIHAVGYPRNDILWQAQPRTDPAGISIVWMPTYRQHRTTASQSVPAVFPLGIPAVHSREELMQLSQLLQKRKITLYLRLHPAQDLSVLHLNRAALDGIVLLDDQYLAAHGTTLYAFLAGTDALITDYSSVYYDYLLTGKPIGLTLEDVEEYSARWPMFVEDMHRLPGRKLMCFSDLLAFVEEIAASSDPCRAQRMQFAESMGIHAMPACAQISEYLMQRLHSEK